MMESKQSQYSQSRYEFSFIVVGIQKIHQDLRIKENWAKITAVMERVRLWIPIL
jgi:hypothetical protein